jgi:hypothetical protein
MSKAKDMNLEAKDKAKDMTFVVKASIEDLISEQIKRITF